MTYHTTAKGLASLGRNGDSMLMHVNPQEVAALSHVLGPVSVNPKTGLPEAFGWGSMLGSIASGIGSFGLGAALEPVIGDMFEEGMMKDIMSKAIPALAGAGVGAAVGGATGGKAGALGGAVQGGMSGGLGAYASNDLLGSGTTPPATQSDAATLDKLTTDRTLPSSPATPDADPLAPKPRYSVTPQQTAISPDQQTAAQQAYVDKGGLAQTDSSLLDNLGTIGHNALTKEGFDKMTPYMDKLFMAGLIGNTLTANSEQQSLARKAQEQAMGYSLAQQQQGRDLAASTYAGLNYDPYRSIGYAEGGPITMRTQGPVPVAVTIPEQKAQEVIDAGGLSSYMQGQHNLHAQGIASFANGGYINTQPFEPNQFYPQSRINAAQPYAAAGPTSVVNTLSKGASFAHGGLIDGDGDGQSDDIDADIDGREPVRVADGEYVVPRHIVDMIGTEKLDKLLKQVREASFGRKEQMTQNGGLEAAKQQLGIA